MYKKCPGTTVQATVPRLRRPRRLLWPALRYSERCSHSGVKGTCIVSWELGCSLWQGVCATFEISRQLIQRNASCFSSFCIKSNVQVVALGRERSADLRTPRHPATPREHRIAIPNAASKISWWLRRKFVSARCLEEIWTCCSVGRFGMRQYNAGPSTRRFVRIVPDIPQLYVWHTICQDLPSTQTSAFILADTPRDVITEYPIPQIREFSDNLTAESVLSDRPILLKTKPYQV